MYVSNVFVYLMCVCVCVCVCVWLYFYKLVEFEMEKGKTASVVATLSLIGREQVAHPRLPIG